MKIFTMFALLALALGTAGCLDYTQEIVINPDGSGATTVDFGISSSLLAMGGQENAEGARDNRDKFSRMRDRLKAHPAVSDAQYREYSEGDLQHFVVTAELNDITRLEELQDELSAEQAGEPSNGNRSVMSVRRQADGTMAFQYLLEVLPPATPEGQDAQMTAATREMMKSAFAGRNFTIRLRGPRVIVPPADGSGVAPAAIAGGVEWKIPFSELFSGAQLSRQLTATVAMRAPDQPRAARAVSVPAFTAVYTGSLVPTLPKYSVANYQSRLLPAVPAYYAVPAWPYYR